MPQNKAIFFDRDGTLNVDVDYLHDPADFVWTEGAVDAVRWANEHGYLAIVVTNQSGVARGYFPESDVTRLHDWMNNELGKYGAHIDALYYCPHHPAAKIAAYRRDCDCRKPAPGLILRALREYDIDPAASLMIGDAPRDVLCAEQAGVRGVLYEGGDLGALLRRAMKEIHIS
jgi:hypothetical protein